jgi:endonuclease/exonuclease/phosphatase family metal-dependent hydrolase
VAEEQGRDGCSFAGRDGLNGRAECLGARWGPWYSPGWLDLIIQPCVRNLIGGPAVRPSIRPAGTRLLPSRADHPSVLPRAASRALVVLAALACLAGGARPALALKLASWNLLAYPNNVATRQPYFRQVIAALDPDVIAVQELATAAGRDSFLANVLDVVQPGQWSATAYFATCQGAVFYKPAKATLTFAGSAVATGGPRDVLGVRLKHAGYVSKLAELRLYSVHLKAGYAAADVTARALECANLRNSMNATSPLVTPNYLVCGDTNIYGSAEGGYQRLTESQADDDGRCFDPLTMPGTWNQSGYAPYHTQSTGALNDRFDLFMTSPTLQDGEGMDLVPGGYVAYGNDGQHYNQSVNGGGVNYAVGMDVASALYYASDHLPVMVTLQAPAKVLAASRLDFGPVIVGATAEQPLTVTNGAAAPADELGYSLAAPAGFAAPAGPFTANAGAAGNVHAVSIVTTDPGVMGGVLTVSCDDPDSTAKLTQLSGTVLAHAVASLDSAGVSTGTSLDFGTHAPGDHADLPVRVHNAGWGALQAKLELTGGVITGGNGRFSIVGGFEAAELAGIGRTCALRFDGVGATADSTYEATLVLSGTDEPLPGASPASDLVVTLSARLLPGDTVVTDPLPERIAFHPPSPNPFHGTTTLRFDLQREADVSLELFDLSGRRVATILQGRRPAGRHSLQLGPVVGGRGPLQAGLYFVNFRAGDFSRTRRLVLVP